MPLKHDTLSQPYFTPIKPINEEIKDYIKVNKDKMKKDTPYNFFTGDRIYNLMVSTKNTTYYPVFFLCDDKTNNTKIKGIYYSNSDNIIKSIFDTGDDGYKFNSITFATITSPRPDGQKDVQASVQFNALFLGRTKMLHGAQYFRYVADKSGKPISNPLSISDFKVFNKDNDEQIGSLTYQRRITVGDNTTKHLYDEYDPQNRSYLANQLIEVTGDIENGKIHIANFVTCSVEKMLLITDAMDGMSRNFNTSQFNRNLTAMMNGLGRRINQQVDKIADSKAAQIAMMFVPM